MYVCTRNESEDLLRGEKKITGEKGEREKEKEKKWDAPCFRERVFCVRWSGTSPSTPFESTFRYIAINLYFIHMHVRVCVCV